MDSTLFGKYQQRPAKMHETQRGEIFDQFLSRLNPSRKAKGLRPLTHARLGQIFEGVPTADLYAVISKCNDAERRGVPWSAAWWTEVKPKPKINT